MLLARGLVESFDPLVITLFTELGLVFVILLRYEYECSLLSRQYFIYQ